MNLVKQIFKEDEGYYPDTAAHRNWIYTISMLTVAYALNIADRQVIYILLEPIKRDLGLYDWEIGAISGLSFALVYAAMALPIARLADRTNRPRLISGALAVWSAGTIASSSVSSFAQLAVARLVVGLGEGGFTPTSHSLIFDSVPPARRTLAFGIFNIAPSVGGMLALAFGGVIADLWGWRAAFLFAGIPGMIIGVIVFLTIRDPRRPRGKGSRSAPANFAGDTLELLKKRSFLLFMLAGGLFGMSAYGTSAFLFSFISRNHADQVGDLSRMISDYFGVHLRGPGLIGPIVGISVLASGTISALISGWLTDRLVARDIRYFSFVAATPLIFAVPVFILMLTTPDLILTLTWYTLGSALITFVVPPTNACIQYLAKPSNRATASALNMVAFVAFGNGLGPFLIGVLSDTAKYWEFGPGRALQIAMLIVTTIPLFMASTLLLIASRHLPGELKAKI